MLWESNTGWLHTYTTNSTNITSHQNLVTFWWRSVDAILWKLSGEQQEPPVLTNRANQQQLVKFKHPYCTLHLRPSPNENFRTFSIIFLLYNEILTRLYIVLIIICSFSCIVDFLFHSIPLICVQRKYFMYLICSIHCIYLIIKK